MSTDDDWRKWRGNCYEAAGLVILFERYELPRGAVNIRLVHGYPVGNVPGLFGKRIGHAWVEFDLEGTEWVLDRTTPLHLVRRAHYYAIGQLDEAHVYRFTTQESRVAALTFGHWGPWAGPDACPPLKKRRQRKKRVSP